jgi:hypothetical protein
MKTYIRALGTSVLLASVLFSRASLASDRSGSVCHEDSGGPRISMRRIAEGVTQDPSRVWTDDEIWNPNTPRGTDIWEGAYKRCDGKTVIVSQIVNRQCSSETVCPIRIVLHDPAGNAERALLHYRQACVLRDTFRIRNDTREFWACDIPFPLN